MSCLLHVNLRESFFSPSFDVVSTVFRNGFSASIGTNDTTGLPLLTPRFLGALIDNFKSAIESRGVYHAEYHSIYRSSNK